MSARRVVIGCSAVALVTVAFLVIGGIVAFKRLTAPAPIPPAARLADSESIGLAVARLEPDDPWVEGTIAELSKYSTRDRKSTEIFPLELVWTERRATGGLEHQILSLSVSGGGRFLGLIGDLMLWRAGRQEHAKVARVDYGGEGITSFPGTPMQGHLFIRDNSFIWSSDLDTAKKAVDLLSRAQEAGSSAGSPATDGLPRVYSMVPQGGRHAIAGAILNENGSLSRSLAMMPGESLDLPVEMLAPVESLTLAIDTTSATSGAGEITLAFAPGTPASAIAQIAKEMCTRLSAVPLAKVTIEATPKLEESRAVLSLKVGGLDSVPAPLFAMFARSVKHIESFSSSRRRSADDDTRKEEKQVEPPAAGKDPNQSSSTFQ